MAGGERPISGRWESFQLDDVQHRQVYVPDGFAHGFCLLSEFPDVTHKVSSYYDPAAESGFALNDPGVGIEWPSPDEPVAPARDREAPSLDDVEGSLPYRYADA